MAKNYWLHRIDHVTELSYPLLDAGYLSYGFQHLSGTDVHRQVQQAKTEDEKWDVFNAAMQANNVTHRSRFSLLRFLKFQRGDLVLVPRRRAFDVFQVKGTAFPAGALAGKEAPIRLPEAVEITDAGFCDRQTGAPYDIGYLVEVEPVRINIPRSFATAPLVSRMKTRQANAGINDLENEILLALNAKEKVSVHDAAIEQMCGVMKDILLTHLTPEQLEQLVCWYFEKKGADRVIIPAKNEHWKTDGADADVIAEFEDLRVIFYVQVKEHVGETDTWSVAQIQKYGEQMKMRNGYTYIPWVLSTATYSEAAQTEANDKGIRLIPGDEFMEMLLDCGIDTIDAAFEKKYPTK